MRPLFWLSLSVILYTYAGYPILIAALARLRPRPWLRAPWQLMEPPISIIMAVHNGAAMLPEKIAHLLALSPELVREIIIVSDGSTDATNQILQQPVPGLAWGFSPTNQALEEDVALAPGRSPDSRLKPILLPTQSGKAVAVNAGIAAASGEILLFVDIRPRIQPGALESLLQNFADPRVGCVAGELLLTQDTHDATSSAVSGLYWRYEQWIRTCEAAVDSPVGVYGGFYAVRRACAVPAPAGLILDDMFQPLAIIRQGFRSVLDRQALVTDRWPSTSAGEFSRKVRTLAGNFQLCREAPWVLSPANPVLFQLVSHKLLRLVVPYFFVTLFLTSLYLGVSYSTSMMIFALLQGAFWSMAVAGLLIPLPKSLRIPAPASALLVLNAAAVVALYKFLFTRGPLWRIWSPTGVEARD